MQRSKMPETENDTLKCTSYQKMLLLHVGLSRESYFTISFDTYEGPLSEALREIYG